MTYTGVLFLNYALFERVEVNSNFFQQFNFTDSTNNYVYAEHTRKTITKVIFSSKVMFVEPSHIRRPQRASWYKKLVCASPDTKNHSTNHPYIISSRQALQVSHKQVIG
jgi:hypothetical protein